MKKLQLLLVIIPLSLCGCAGTWLHGTMMRNDGAPFSFSIQTAMAAGGSASAGLLATNLTTQESFTGRYTGILPSRSKNEWAAANAWGAEGFGTAQSYGFTEWRSDVADAQGFLRSTNGTLIQLRMKIHAGLAPHGFGEGKDNQAHQYQVQFEKQIIISPLL